MSPKEPNEGIPEYKSDEKALLAQEQEHRPTMTSYDSLTIFAYGGKP